MNVECIFYKSYPPQKILKTNYYNQENWLKKQTNKKPYIEMHI